MKSVCGYIRYNGETVPVMNDDEESIFFIDEVSNTEVYIEGDVPASLLSLERPNEHGQSELILSLIHISEPTRP